MRTHEWQHCRNPLCWHLRTEKYNAMAVNRGAFAEAWFAPIGEPAQNMHLFFSHTKRKDAPPDDWFVRHYDCEDPLASAREFIDSVIR